MATFRETTTRDLDTAAESPSRAVLRVSLCVTAILLTTLVPYLVPSLHDYRVLIGEDGDPFAGMFDTKGAGPLVAEASGGLASHAPADEKTAELLSDLEEVSHTSLVVDASVPAPKTREIPTTQTPAASEAPVTPAPLPEAGGDDIPLSAQYAAIVVPPEDYKDVEVHIEDPHGAMKHFYTSLHETAKRSPGAITRVAHWGDSAIAADGMTSAARIKLQQLFGDSGHGFLLAASSSSWYAHKGVRYGSKGWKTLNVIHRAAKDKRYGFGGVRARGFPGVYSRFATADKGPVGRKVSRFDIYYLAAPKQGELALRVDKGDPVYISTAADTPEDRVYTVEVPDGPHELRLQARGGRLNVYGVVMERDQPGVVYDGLGIVGFIEDRHHNSDFEHFKGQLARRGTDLMILMYGGNKLGFPNLGMSRYEKDFEKVVKRFRRAGPKISCLVMSPLDHGERHRGKIRTVPKLHKMVEIQRRVALRNGCAWYSVFEAMGGEGSMGRWSRSKPALGWKDYAHVTKHGANVLGTLFYQALMSGYVEHIRE
jgi:hypothetical protein